MTCQECGDLLSALIDRELSAQELNQVRAHLQECASCCRECAELCCVDAATKQTCCPNAPADLWERVWVCCTPQSQQTLTAQDVLTPEEAAVYLRLSPSDLLASLDALPHFKIGEHTRFRRCALEEWMQTQERKVTP
jgi:excisionase family DNA binding protein